MVIHTCKGLKRPNRLINGVKPASGIFQRYIANSLSNVKNTVVGIDDILISGFDDDQHLTTLRKVLEIIRQSGARINMKKCVFCAGSEIPGFHY